MRDNGIIPKWNKDDSISVICCRSSYSLLIRSCPDGEHRSDTTHGIMLHGASTSVELIAALCKYHAIVPASRQSFPVGSEWNVLDCNVDPQD
eukprot:3748824-Amphidinium_carterae.1